MLSKIQSGGMKQCLDKKGSKDVLKKLRDFPKNTLTGLDSAKDI